MQNMSFQLFSWLAWDLKCLWLKQDFVSLGLSLIAIDEYVTRKEAEKLAQEADYIYVVKKRLIQKIQERRLQESENL